MKDIIVDSETIKTIDTKLYNKVYVIGYGKDDINELLKYEIKDSNIEVLLPTSNFDKAYRNINKYVADLVNGNIELLSLFKLCKKDLFNMGMIMIGLAKTKSNFKVYTIYNEYLVDLNIIKVTDLCTDIKIIKQYKIHYIKQILMLIIINFKAIAMYFKSFFIRPLNIDKLLMDHSNKNILATLEKEQNTLLIDIHGAGSIINYNGLTKFFTQQKQLFKLSKKYKILYQTIAKQSFYTLKIVSIVNYYNPKVILGALDAVVTVDIYVLILKQYHIKFGCYSHGYNYDFRTEYVYIPFDFYFIWSKIHLEHIQAGNYIESDCKFYITGSPLYENLDFKAMLQQKIKKKYDILVIGEYYYDDYSIQPFNSKSTFQLANILKKYAKQYRICIRPRMNDQYYADMHSILGDSVTYSFPKNQSNANTSMLYDIQSSRVILGVFTAGINDAFLLNKPVIHINLIGILEPRYFDKNNAKYYADTKEKLESILNNIFRNDIKNINFDMNNYYFNDGIYDINKVQEVLVDSF